MPHCSIKAGARVLGQQHPSRPRFERSGNVQRAHQGGFFTPQLWYKRGLMKFKLMVMFYSMQGWFRRDPLFLYFLKVAILSSIGIYLILLIPTAQANHNPDYCMEQSNIAFLMADARDSNIPMRAFLSRSERLSPEELPNYLNTIKMVYSNSDALPERLGSIVYNLCMDHGRR